MFSRMLLPLKQMYERFIRIRGNPREIALGFALGIFVGMSPTMGVQIIIAVFIAALLKWNKISATIAVFITNPFTAPFIYGTTYLVGAKILGVKKPFIFPKQFDIDAARNILEGTPRIFGALTVGGIVIGLPLAIAAYYVSYAAIVQARKKLHKKLPLKNRTNTEP